MEINNHQIFKDLFSRLSVKELNDSIEYFRNNVDIRSSSEEKIRNELKKIFTVKYKDDFVSFFLNADIEIPQFQKNYFYRIREFQSEDYLGLITKCFSSIQRKQDVWCRPNIEVKNYGRLNRPGKSVLYLSSQSVNAIYEKECKIGDFFFLSIYQTKLKNIRMSQIQNIQYLDGFSEEENAKRILMHNFLFSEFTKYVSAGREYLYKSSLIIYEDYFCNDKIDGFCYPSIASNFNMGYNVCFSQEKVDLNLSLVCVMVCKLLPSDGKSEFRVQPIYDGLLKDDNTISFHDYNSEFIQNKIGDYKMIRDLGIL